MTVADSPAPRNGERRAFVIGAGISGLAAATQLATTITPTPVAPATTPSTAQETP